MKAYRLAPGTPLSPWPWARHSPMPGTIPKRFHVLEHAVELEPKSADAAYQLALVLQRVDSVPDAIEFTEESC